MNRLSVGCHLSIAGGYVDIVQTALQIDATTFAFFPRNPRGKAQRVASDDELGQCRLLLAKHDLGPIVAHAPYTYNLASANPKIRAFTRNMLTEDLELLSKLPPMFYNIHPGAHVGQGVEVGISHIVKALQKLREHGNHTTILLETMAGKGSEIGGTFEEIAAILTQVDDPNFLGVCFDTCHVHDAGYDIVHHFDEVLEEFDRVIGLDHLKALHLNDSLNPCGSHKDRHACLGKGTIGYDVFSFVVNHPRLKTLPTVLETPSDLVGWAREIAWLRSHVL